MGKEYGVGVALWYCRVMYGVYLLYIFIYIILYYTHNLRHVYIWYKPSIYQTSMRQDSPGRNSLQFLQANLIHCLQHTYL
jgi:hypothetical protein